MPTAKQSLAASRKIPASMKIKIAPYVLTGSRYVNGVLYDLKMATEVKKTSRKANGVSFGADKNGFFVYTHRCRSKSRKTPKGITKKEIDFVESTG